MVNHWHRCARMWLEFVWCHRIDDINSYSKYHKVLSKTNFDVTAPKYVLVGIEFNQSFFLFVFTKKVHGIFSKCFSIILLVSICLRFTVVWKYGLYGGNSPKCSSPAIAISWDPVGSTNVFDVINRAQGLEFLSYTEWNEPWQKWMVQHSVLRGWSTPPYKPTTLKASWLIVWCWFFRVGVQMFICHSENPVRWDAFMLLFEKLVMLPSSAAWDCEKHLLVNYLNKPTDSSSFYIIIHGTKFSLCFTKWVKLLLVCQACQVKADLKFIHSFL